MHALGRNWGRSFFVAGPFLFSYAQLLKWTALAFLFAIPLGTKKFLFSFSTPFSNFYTSEYTAAFLFGSDLVLIAFLGLAVYAFFRNGTRESIRIPRIHGTFFTLFLALAAISLISATYFAFGMYAFSRLALAVAAAGGIWWVMRSGIVSISHIAGVLAASAVLQSVIAVLQFLNQGSVGLPWLGETVALGPVTPGIATVAVGGLSFLRAYGTLPHANILAGFLVIGLSALAYLFFEGKHAAVRMIAAAGVTMTLAGLLVTFSRSGWIVTACMLTATLIFAWTRKPHRTRAYEFGFVALLSLMALLATLNFVVLPRAHLSASEEPVRDRLTYNEMGLSTVVERPWGVGIGNQLFYSYDQGIFPEYGLSARGQWQPIHNLFLLVAVEIGVLGLACFFACIVAAWGRGWNENNFARGIFGILFASLLLFGLFDHFLWDLQAGRLMLWGVLGILWALGSSIARARSSTDRAYPSEG